MALETKVGPPRLAINQGYAILVTDQDGQIPWPTDKGFYHRDTRVISSWQVFADGRPWRLLNSGNLSYFSCRIFLTNPKLPTESGAIEAGALSLAIGRTLCGGVHEDLDLENHGDRKARFNLEIAIRSDFADLFEVKSGGIVRRGRIQTSWKPRSGRLTTRYCNRDFVREVSVSVSKADSKPVFANGRLSFEIGLEPQQTWHACLLYDLVAGETVEQAPRPCIAAVHDAKAARGLKSWRDMAMKVQTSNEEFYRFYRQAVDDMASLRLPIEGTDHVQFVPAAGTPWFVALFGRDCLVASLQNAMVHPDFARGSLEVLGRYQAKKRDDYRDAEPGKIMHELRRGELAHFGLIPHTPYYGTADATILYLIVLHSAWRCSGDDRLLEQFLPIAEKCLDWIDDCGDRDKDGFQEYATRSQHGYVNQGWKDSSDAVVYPDGSQVQGPIALVELQGYVYDAWLRMAEIYDAIGKPRRAGRLRRKAATLFDQFNSAFWDETEGFYAFCLDGDKRRVMSVASNPGHCLWSGIVPQERAGRVVSRLMRPDMSTGWGIRTLSADHPAFNPNSYQVGSVWPHDNAIIAQGFRRYGFVQEAMQVARDISRAASSFLFHQMPELYAGRQRTPANFPVQYLGANTPQAWAAGSCFSLLQMIVGFQPDAPHGLLYLDPALPDWMDDLTLRDLRVGEQVFDLRFQRTNGRTSCEVLTGDAARVKLRSCSSGPQRI